ncbi:lipopolysaccharide biosynthesis protein, partial [Endozoicomonas arenosclerae]|uniref:lipopolysaccharide biosynthesis protein n=1 Tax=Endozoicomonas arenosclerae TaxID=1633495 RepID=UPI0007853358
SVFIVALLFLLNFTMLVTDQVLHAVNETGKTILKQFLSNVLVLLVLYFGMVTFESNLVIQSISYGFSTLIVSLLFTVWFFLKNKKLRPRFSYFNRKKIASIGNVGAQFFVIQIAVLVLFSTDKIIITQILGPEEVVPYEIIFRLFSFLIIMASIYFNPLWAIYTKAYAEKNIQVIVKNLRRSKILLLFSILIASFIYLFHDELISLWIGQTISIPSNLALAMAVYMLTRVWCDIYAYFLNGASKIKIQMYLAIVQALLNIPLSIIFARHYGSVGVVYASTLSLCLSALILPINNHFVLKKLEFEKTRG